MFTLLLSFFDDPYGNRTHDYAVKGRRLSRLTNGPNEWLRQDLNQ